ncbi:hypothetical protein ASC89_17915 [Devosia sp. Root413D1]|uniref:hypothetical protein n=1 Tax=unclassified Devosia TaxID=196773 RepID=UPI0007005998|nr:MULTISPECIES: hypothetical protein [unclassified Devosia]KQU96731.1 hypothetical protein ASC68_15360 [Devosia sp. Root105]KQW77081.1 hypothetical protein ASC89_17915 [Devosia sp. Root413D1]
MVITESCVLLATEVVYARAMEALAGDLAIYFAAGTHQPLDNARQAITRMLERTMELPLATYLEGFSLTAAETDEAMSRSLARIGQSIQLIRAAALPSQQL